MKNIITLACMVCLFSCNQPGSEKETETKKAQQTDSTKKRTDTLISKKADTTLLLKISADILTAAKTRDYQKFGSFIHPDKAVRFYPFSYIDSATGKKISGNDLIALAKQKKKIDWGSGYADPEKLTADQYFARCVYDKDYLKLGQSAVNKTHRGGTAEAFNFEEVFAGHDFTEFFFPGTEVNGNMDWSAVRLVFELKDNTPYLVAIVYDRWTP